MLKKMQLLLAVMLFSATSMMAQMTTSGISGHVTSNKEDVIGATITATHKPSGTVYRAVTNEYGRYTIQGMRVGGPYAVEVSYIGYQTKTFNNVSLLLGETQTLSCSLQEDATMLDELVVTGKRGLNASKTGAAQSISAEMINNIPTVSHSIADIARLNPQISTNEQSGGMSFAGTNNRYNAFQIDGVMNNDTFGLTANGQNGAQAGAQPVSMETIDQIQINVAPFDVRQGGFTGGAINATTKSGTNEFHGSAYAYGNNEDLVGRHYLNPDGTYSLPYDKEKEYLFGATLGGPIIKNKLFFFVNYEKSDKEYANMYGIGTVGQKIPENLANNVLAAVKDMAARQGYQYGGQFSDADKFIRSQKLGAKIDWNINDFNKLTLRWSYMNSRQLNGLGGISTLNTDDHIYTFPNRTNSFIAELQSRLSPTLSNEARASYVAVRDRRMAATPFPQVTIYNVGSGDKIGTVNIGNEYSSMANGLDQNIYTLEDNLTWYKGNHTLTFGTHNEVYNFSNLFIQNLYGCYYFNSYGDFMNYYDGFLANGGVGDGTLIRNYYYTRANQDVTGDPLWAAEFSAAQLGFYVQDKWDAADNFQLTYGLRMDLPVFFDKPTENTGFNDYAASKGWNYKTNQKLRSTPMWSPRVGFRWDVNNNRKLIVRGGIGIFTGRIPFVWLSNSFSNTGIQLQAYSVSNSPNTQLLLDPARQDENAERLTASGNQTINVFDKNFKFAQNLRLNLGVDANLLGIDWTAEAIYSKTLNDVYYQQLAYEETGYTFNQMTYGYDWDNRPMFQRATSGTPYSNIYALKNSSDGYSYSLSLKGEKHFRNVDLAASYTFTRSRAVSSVTSSVAQSNWRNNHTYRNPNKPELANSAFNVPHAIKASAFYHFNTFGLKWMTTTVGLMYEGRSGSPYSLYVSGDMNGDGYNGNDLMYIPTDAQVDQMRFVDYTSGDVTIPAADQKANFKAWLANTPYVRSHRGQYYKRYADNLPFENHFDFHFAQKFNIKTGTYVHGLEFTFDIMNVGNLLNKDWGRTYSSSYMSQYMAPLTYNGNGNFLFIRSADNPLAYPSTYYSRWRGQVGVKYTF